MTRRATSAVAMVCVALIACGAPPIRTPQRSPSPAQLRELWTDPGTSPRDLYWGIGGKRLAPQPGAAYEFEGLDTSGFSSSYDLGDPSGVSWSAKIGPEAQTEVVLSRVLWGIGYHQPPVYYLPSWTLDRCGKRKTIGEARFRPKLSQLERLNEPWSWQQNPFVGTHELSGLLTVLLMFNSTDLKNTNNSLYVPRTPWDGARQWFVVRDLGAALGKTGKLNPRRNWLEGFEARGFITAIHGDAVAFDYHGRHQELISMIHPADVEWAARRLGRLTNDQWRDAFRAADYSNADASRFIHRLRQKIDDGMALRARPVNRLAH